MNAQQHSHRTTPIRYTTDVAKWRAVTSKDRDADGAFYYSVRTTGVYCLPSCAARPALRENVAFHDSAEAAERAGFRACKRCRPAGPTLAEEHAAAVGVACRSIERGEGPLTLDALARTAGMSGSHFHRVFKAVTGLTPKAYAVAHRAQRLREALPQRDTVTEAIYEAGFNSSGRFYSNASETLGMTPTKFRKGGLGSTIRFAVGECSLGSVLVAASERGVCTILLGDDPGELVRDLQDRFPNAELIGADRAFERTVALVIGFIEAPRTGLALPLDIQGSAFQLRVWRALQEIPTGSVATYAEIAARIGAPTAARAVARACSANPVAVAIPCHRVVRTDGKRDGYRWGVERKRALLDREREATVLAG